MLPSIKYVIILLIAVIIILAGLLFLKEQYFTNLKTEVEAFENPHHNKLKIVFKRPEWIGLWGPNGPGGVRKYGYAAKLEGEGENGIFKNPYFQDVTSLRTKGCEGTIIIHKESNTFDVKLYRIIILDGGNTSLKPHPINGTYALPQITTVDEKVWWGGPEWKNPD